MEITELLHQKDFWVTEADSHLNFLDKFPQVSMLPSFCVRKNLESSRVKIYIGQSNRYGENWFFGPGSLQRHYLSISNVTFCGSYLTGSKVVTHSQLYSAESWNPLWYSTSREIWAIRPQIWTEFCPEFAKKVLYFCNISLWSRTIRLNIKKLRPNP